MVQMLDMFLIHYGLLAVFLVLFAKSVGVPIPIPMDLIVLATAVRAAQGKLLVWQACVVILLAVVLGSLVQFALASGPGRGVLYRFGRYIGLTPARLDAAAKRVKQGGLVGITTAMLVPGIRGVAITACGLVGVPLAIFLPGLIVGSGLFLALHFLLGYFGLSLFVVVGHLLPSVTVLALVAGLLLITFALWYVAFRRQRMARQEVEGASLEVLHEGICPVCLAIYAASQVVTFPLER